MKTKIISIYGAPNAGKSTLAAEIFAFLKKQNKSVELVTEVAKDYVYTGLYPDKYEQIKIASKQLYNEALKYGKVEYIVTDCPIYLPYFYLQYNHGIYITGSFCQYYTLLTALDNIEHINFYLESNYEYQQQGRFETKEQSDNLNKALKLFLNNFVNYSLVTNFEDVMKDIKI